MPPVTKTWPASHGVTVGSNTNVTMPTSSVRITGSATITPYVYVCDSGNNRIQVFNHSGTFLFSFGSFGAGNGQFNAPYGVTNDGTRVYVTDTGNNRVQYFDLLGNYLGQWGSLGTGDGQFQDPMGIAVNGRYAFVVDQTNNRFQIFSALGTFILSVGEFGSGVNQFNSPTDCYVDEFFLYINDNGNSRIVIYALTLPTTDVVSTFPEFTSSIATAIRSGNLNAIFPQITTSITTGVFMATVVNSQIPNISTSISTRVILHSDLNVTIPLFRSDIIVSGRSHGDIRATLPNFQTSISSQGEVYAAIVSQFPDYRSAIVSRIVGGQTVNVVVINTENKSISNYTNYDFNSMTMFQDKYIGADSTGIYEMTGTDDDTITVPQDIQCVIKTGIFDLWENNQVRSLEDISLYGSFGDDVTLIFRGNIDTLRQFLIRTYNTTSSTTLRQKLGRGLKDREFSIEIRNANGGNLELMDVAIDAEAIYRQKKRG